MVVAATSEGAAAAAAVAVGVPVAARDPLATAEVVAVVLLTVPWID